MTKEPIAGKIAPAVESLVGELLTEVGRLDDNPIALYLEMLTGSPIISAAVEVKVLLGLSMLGEYQHEDEDIQVFIRSNFEQMNGSLNLSVSELLSSIPLGYSFSEWAVDLIESEWRLQSLSILNPKNYRFEGRLGAIENVVYSGASGDIRIPYERGVHIVNARYLCFGEPYGIAECSRAIAAWKAWKIIIGEMLVAGQRQATPIIVGQADSNDSVPLLNPQGLPLVDINNNPITIPAPKALLEQLVNLDNRSVIATDIKNKITALAQQTDGQFFMSALAYIQRLMLLAFMVPETIFEVGRGGLGNAGLNEGHIMVLEGNVRSTIDQVREQLLERLIRNLITWNKGEQENYGAFVQPETDNTDKVALLDSITRAVSAGSFSSADLEVINKQRELAGIPKVEALASNMSRGTDYWRAA